MNNIHIYPIESYYDDRGIINSIWTENNNYPKFVEDRVCYSNYNVLRGLHTDNINWKLFICLHGSIYLTVVDCKGKTETVFLNDKIKQAVLVPPTYFNGTYTISESSIMLYKWSHGYIPPEKQITLKWDDPDVNISWVCSNPILSDRDKNGKSWKQINEAN